MVLKQSCQDVPKPLSLKCNSLFNFIGCLVYQGCQWIVTVLVVYLSGYEASGVLAYAMAIGNIFLPIATFNLRTFQVSDINEACTTGEYLLFRAITIICAFFLVIPYAFFTTTDKALLIPILPYLFFKADESLCDALSGVHQRGQRMDYIGISQFSRGLLIVLSFSIGLMAFNNLTASFIFMFLACGAMTVMFDVPHALRFGSISLSIRKKSAIRLFKAGLPLMLSAAFSSLVVTIARQNYLNISSSEQLGIYAAVATPSVLVQAASRYLYSPVLVPLATSYLNESKSYFLSRLSSYSLKLLVGIGIIGLALVLGGPTVLKIMYGSFISDYVYLLPTMVLATMLNTFQLFYSDVLVICRDIKATLISGLVGFLVCLLISFPLEDSFGMQGINIAILISYGLSLVVLLVRLCIAIRRDDSRE